MKIKRVVAIVLTVAFMLCCAAMPVAAATFSDTENHWAKDSIERWAAADVLNGYDDGTYKPDGDITRAEMAKVISVVLGLDKAAENKFSDVPAGEWYTEYVLECAEVGIINGYPDGTFLPQKAIARQEAFVMFDRAFGLEDGTAADIAAFSDAATVADWALGATAALVNLDAVNGENGKLNPTDTITRAEVAKILDYLVAVYVDAEGDISVGTAGGNLVVVNQNVQTSVVVYKSAEGVVVTVGETTKEATISNDVAPVVVIATNLENGMIAAVEVGEVGVGIEGPEKAEICDHGEWVSDCTTTCAVDHDEIFACTECGLTKTEVKVAAPHVFVGDTCENCHNTVADLTKFELKVESGAAVVGTVTDDYCAVLKVDNGTVDAGKVVLTATMQDVGSLGLEEGEKRSHSIEIETGIDKDGVDLTTHLANVFEFETATVNVNIDGKELSYVLKGSKDAEGNAIITATTNVKDARAAWKELTSHVEPDTDKDDSKVIIGNGSYAVIGGEMISFEEDYNGHLVLDNFSELSALRGEIKKAVKLTEAPAEAAAIELFVKAETALHVSSSKAVLKDDCTIKVSNVENLPNNILTTIQGASDSNTALVKALVDLVDDIVGAVDGQTVDVDITF